MKPSAARSTTNWPRRADLAKRLDVAVDGKLAEALTKLAQNREAVDAARLPWLSLSTTSPHCPCCKAKDWTNLIRSRSIVSPPKTQSPFGKGGVAATLKGIEFNNFGAFFSRSYRENDYLWGRLHGAERMIDIMLSTLPEANRPERGKNTGPSRRTIFSYHRH